MGNFLKLFRKKEKMQRKAHGTSRKITLSLMILGTLMAGQACIADAAYTSGIIGDQEQDRANFPDAQITGDDDHLTYDFHGKDVTFHIRNTNPTDTDTPLNPDRNQEIVINNRGGTLHMNIVNTASNTFQGIAAINAIFGDRITINSDVSTSVYADYMADGIALQGDNVHVTINGNVKMRKDNPDSPWGIITNNTHGNYGPGGAVSSSAPNYTGARWQPTAIWNNGTGGSTVDMNGDFDVAVRGTAVASDPYSMSGGNPYTTDIINLNKGNITIETPKSTSESYYALAGYGGTINVNITNGTANPAHDVKILGNIITTGADDAPFYVRGQVNMGLANDKSSWTGIIDNAGKKLAGTVNLWLRNGAVWNHESMSRKNGLQPENMPSPSNQNHYERYDGTSYVTNLFGGRTEGSAGVIFQRDSAPIDIRHFKGHVLLDYEHSGSGSRDSDYSAGNTTVHSADEGSQVTLSTSSRGIAMGDKKSVEETLTALAHKLYYTAGDSHLTGKVQIAEGLVTSSASKMVGQMNFSDGGRGNYITGTVTNGEAPVKPDNPDGPDAPDIPVDPGQSGAEEERTHYGDYETGLMKGTREAIMTSILDWRNHALDSIHRIDLLRDRLPGDRDGVWAKVYRNKFLYKNGNHISDNYTAFQAGYDRNYDNGWIAGAGIDYLDGSAGYEYGGHGDNKLYSFNVYGSKDLGNNAYFDITAKAGHVENEYHVFNRGGRRLDGEYQNRAYSFSTRLGKRFVSRGFYWEPEVQLAYTYMGGKDFKGRSEAETLFVHEHPYQGLIGHAGLEIGKQNERSTFYGRLGINHDFTGQVKGDYSDGNGNLKRTEYSVKDTWYDVTLGGDYRFSSEGKFYMEISKGFGSHYANDWQIGAGLRMLVGSGKHPAASTAGEKTSFPGAAKKMPLNSPKKPALTGTAGTGTPAAASKAAVKQPEKGASLPGTSNRPGRIESGEQDVTYDNSGAYRVYQVGTSDGMVSFELGPVVVTARRTPQPILEAKADMSVVSRQEIEDLHIGNIEEALRTVPGVQFLNYGGNALNGNISGIRINGSKDIVVLVDGVKVTDLKGPGQNGYIYSALLSNPDNIERIEVLRGSASTMYGSGAKGGVINIITRKISRTQTSMDISKGNFGKENYRFDTQGRKGRFGYNIYQDKTLSGDFKDGGGVKWHGHTNTKAEGAKLFWDFNDDHTLTYSYDSNHSRYNGWDRIYIGPYHGFYKLDTHTVNDEWKLSSHWSNSLTYRRSREKAEYAKPMGEGNVYGLVRASPYSDSKNYTYDFISDHINYTAGGHSIIMGVDYSKADGYSYNTGSSKSFTSHSMKNTSWYIQDDWKIFPRITLSGGIRHDKPSLDTAESHNSKSYKLSWDMTDKDTVYAGRSDYFILPSMDQLYNSDGSDSRLKPSYGRTTTIGYNRKFSDSSLFTFNWYDTKAASDIGTAWSSSGQSVTIDPTTGKPIWHYVNTRNRTLGWNAQYEGKLNDRLSCRLGWAHMKVTSTETFVDHGYAPKDLITFGLTYDWNKWKMALDGYYFIRLDSRNNHFTNSRYGEMKSFPSDKYAVFNLSADYSPRKDLTFYMKVENLFDKLYAEHTDVSWNPSAGPGRWYSLPGRTVIFGMNVRF